MKKLHSCFSTLFVFIVCFFAHTSAVEAQTSEADYKKELERWLVTDNSLQQDMFMTSFKPFTVKSLKTLVPNPYKSDAELNAAADQYVQLYMDTQMKKDLVDIYYPYFVKNVTIEELREVIALRENPKTQAALQRMEKNFSTETMNSLLQKELSAKLQTALMDIVQGNTPANVPLPDGCSQAYLNATTVYYKYSGTKEILDGMMRMVEQMLAQSSAKAGDLVKQISQYFDKNMPVMLASMMYEKVSLEDLNEVNRLTMQPTYKKVTAAVAEYSSNLINMGSLMETKYRAWFFEQPKPLS